MLLGYNVSHMGQRFSIKQSEMKRSGALVFRSQAAFISAPRSHFVRFVFLEFQHLSFFLVVFFFTVWFWWRDPNHFCELSGH